MAMAPNPDFLDIPRVLANISSCDGTGYDSLMIIAFRPRMSTTGPGFRIISPVPGTGTSIQAANTGNHVEALKRRFVVNLTHRIDFPLLEHAIVANAILVALFSLQFRTPLG